MANKSFAKKVFETVTRLAGSSGLGEVNVADLAEAVFIQTAKEHKRMLNALSDLKKAGKINRVRQGVYVVSYHYHHQSETRAVMWRVLRMRKAVTIDDLVEMAGASAAYAKEWLQMLDKRGVVRRIPQPDNKQHVWRLIKDTVGMPVDEEKAAKLRALHKKKKQQAVQDLLSAQELIGKACLAINELEGCDHE